MVDRPIGCAVGKANPFPQKEMNGPPQSRKEFLTSMFSPQIPTLEDMVQQLGDIPLKRIRTNPPPGTATEADLIASLDGSEKGLCELIDGVLVEKAVGALEAYLAGVLVRLKRPRNTSSRINLFQEEPFCRDSICLWLNCLNALRTHRRNASNSSRK